MGMDGMLKPLSAEELAAVLDDPMGVEDMLFPEDVANPFEGQFDLHKYWHELHYLLTGCLGLDGSVLGEAVLGGKEVGSELGYGRARLITAERVKDILAALLELDFTVLVASVNRHAAEIDDVYAGSGLRGDASYLERPFQVLIDAYRTAANGNQALLVYLA